MNIRLGVYEIFSRIVPGGLYLSVSLLIIQEARKFREWFYDGIFETVLAYRIDLDSAIRPVNVKSRKVK